MDTRTVNSMRHVLERITTDDNYPTTTSKAQRQVELALLNFDQRKPPLTGHQSTELQRQLTLHYLHDAITEGVEDYYVALDASQPWLCYWILHAIDLLDISAPPFQTPVDTKTANNTIAFLKRCQSKNGGYGGGPGQNPHLATTFAAISALAVIGTQKQHQPQKQNLGSEDRIHQPRRDYRGKSSSSCRGDLLFKDGLFLSPSIRVRNGCCF